MNKLVFIFIAVLFSSCASICNKEYTKFRFHAPQGSLVTYGNTEGSTDSVIAERKDGVTIVAIRSRSPFVVGIKNDTIDTIVSIRPVFSKNWYYNIFTCGFGFLVDIGSVKKYGYPFNVHYNPASRHGYGYGAVKPYIVPRSQLTILPWFTNFCKIKYGDVPTNGIGIILGVGYNYYTKPNKFYAFDAVVSGDPLTIAERFYPDSVVPRPTIRKNGQYVNVRQHIVLRKFDIGYGLSGGRMTWTRYYETRPAVTYQNGALDSMAKSFTLGCSFAANFRISNSFYAGVNYQPHFIEFGDKATINYSHIISGGLYWRIRLSRYNK